MKNLFFSLLSAVIALSAFSKKADEGWLGITVNGTRIPSAGYSPYDGSGKGVIYQSEGHALNLGFNYTSPTSGEPEKQVSEYVIDADPNAPDAGAPIEPIKINCNMFDSALRTVKILGGYFGESFGMNRLDSNVTHGVTVEISGGTFLCTSDPFHDPEAAYRNFDGYNYFEATAEDWAERSSRKSESRVIITGGSFAFDPTTIQMWMPVYDANGNLEREGPEDGRYAVKMQYEGVIPSGFRAGYDESTGFWTVKPDTRWTIYEHPSDGPFVGNTTYTGWVRGEDNSIKGTLIIKTGKPGKGKESKPTITYVPIDGPKQPVKIPKGEYPVIGGKPELEIPGIGTVLFCEDHVEGVDVNVQMGVDYSKSKNNGRLAGKAGVFTFAFETESGYAAFTVTVDRKGKGKFKGTFPDGTKCSVSSQGVLGDSALAIPFVCSKKVKFGFVLWLKDDGVRALTDITPIKTAGGEISVRSAVGPSASFALAQREEGRRFRCGATEQEFTVAGTKWVVLKKNKKLKIDPNPTGLKLTFAAKTGLVKGSFSLQSSNGKVKYNVNGVVVGDALYGSASAKGWEPIPVMAE